MNHRGLLVVVSGFSGVGKGTLVKKLVTECDNYALSVSMTTRKPREGEIVRKVEINLKVLRLCRHF